MNRTITINCAQIIDWQSFHDVFASAFGFPAFYGCSGNAWIDCMTRLDEEFSMFQVAKDHIVILQLENADALKKSAPHILNDLLEMAAFVNWRRIKIGDQPILLVSGYA